VTKKGWPVSQGIRKYPIGSENDYHGNQGGSVANILHAGGTPKIEASVFCRTKHEPKGNSVG